MRGAGIRHPSQGPDSALLVARTPLLSGSAVLGSLAILFCLWVFFLPRSALLCDFRTSFCSGAQYFFHYAAVNLSLLSLSHSSVIGRLVCEPALAAPTFKAVIHIKDLPFLLKKHAFHLLKDRIHLLCKFSLENPKSDLPGFEDGRLFLFLLCFCLSICPHVFFIHQ